MALPKRKASRSRRDKRRSHDALTASQYSNCPQCQEPKLPHRVCMHCGYYNGREVIKIADATK
ncbi:MAG: 50S ribosomal protein L32 [Candidatus Schekmanbacteria bacterium RBG_16_38_10]|uniref:Large ribosomal subunit protein bL32 n=1 Tax=Candidatus Schekmanbacteria bacterium RBG_16_38_10 TaxID=1817879 RepID=A0A1F7RT88_9BACT|nr:MAG: 50S ribosomal protein L32 [Candidatus Schekmanbacteria bacterium RBG_16_38_10]